MLENVVASVLDATLGKYVVGIDRKSLKLSALKGRLHLENLEINTEVVNALGLPVEVTRGFIGSLDVNLPWAHLKSKPVVAAIGAVYLVVRPLSPLRPYRAADDDAAHSAKMRKVRAWEAGLDSKPKAKDKEKGDGFVKHLVQRIVNNLQVNITSIHIRYEDDGISCPGRQIACGVTIGKVALMTTDAEGHPSYVVDDTATLYKRVEVQNAALYLNTGRETGGTEESCSSIEFLQRTCQAAPGSLPPGFQYLLEPLTVVSTIVLRQHGNPWELTPPAPRLELSVEVPRIGMTLSESQYSGIIKTVGFVANYSSKSRFRRIRPTVPVCTDPKAWWRYAYQAVVQFMGLRSHNFTWEHIRSRRDTRRRYVDLYQTAHRVPWYGAVSKSRSREAHEELEALHRQLAYADIILYRFVALTVCRVEGERHKSKSKGGGFLGWFRRRARDSEDGDSTDESAGKSAREIITGKMTAEEVSQLDELLEYRSDKSLSSQDPVAGSPPSEWTAMCCRIKLGAFDASLRSAVPDLPLVTGTLSDFSATIGLRPDAKGIDVGASVARFGVVDCYTEPMVDSRLAFSDTDSDGSKEDWATLSVSVNPPSFDNSIRVNSRVHVITWQLNSTIIQRLVLFFVEPELPDFSGLSVRAKGRLRREIAQSRLLEIDDGKRAPKPDTSEDNKPPPSLFLDIHVHAPRIVFTGDPGSQFAPRIMADLGHLSVTTLDATTAEHATSFLGTAASLYGTHRIHLTQVRLSIIEGADGPSTTNVIHPIDADIMLWLRMQKPELQMEAPALISSVNIGSIQLSFSDNQSNRLSRIVASAVGSSKPQKWERAALCREAPGGRHVALVAGSIYVLPNLQRGTTPDAVYHLGHYTYSRTEAGHVIVAREGSAGSVQDDLGPGDWLWDELTRVQTESDATVGTTFGTAYAVEVVGENVFSDGVGEVGKTILESDSDEEFEDALDTEGITAQVANAIQVTVTLAGATAELRRESSRARGGEVYSTGPLVTASMGRSRLSVMQCRKRVEVDLTLGDVVLEDSQLPPDTPGRVMGSIISNTQKGADSALLSLEYVLDSDKGSDAAINTLSAQIAQYSVSLNRTCLRSIAEVLVDNVVAFREEFSRARAYAPPEVAPEPRRNAASKPSTGARRRCPRKGRRLLQLTLHAGRLDWGLNAEHQWRFATASCQGLILDMAVGPSGEMDLAVRLKSVRVDDTAHQSDTLYPHIMYMGRAEDGGGGNVLDINVRTLGRMPLSPERPNDLEVAVTVAPVCLVLEFDFMLSLMDYLRAGSVAIIGKAAKRALVTSADTASKSLQKESPPRRIVVNVGAPLIIVPVGRKRLGGLMVRLGDLDIKETVTAPSGSAGEDIVHMNLRGVSVEAIDDTRPGVTCDEYLASELGKSAISIGATQAMEVVDRSWIGGVQCTTVIEDVTMNTHLVLPNTTGGNKHVRLTAQVSPIHVVVSKDVLSLAIRVLRAALEAQDAIESPETTLALPPSKPEVVSIGTKPKNGSGAREPAPCVALEVTMEVTEWSMALHAGHDMDSAVGTALVTYRCSGLCGRIGNNINRDGLIVREIVYATVSIADVELIDEVKRGQGQGSRDQAACLLTTVPLKRGESGVFEVDVDVDPNGVDVRVSVCKSTLRLRPEPVLLIIGTAVWLTKEVVSTLAFARHCLRKSQHQRPQPSKQHEDELSRTPGKAVCVSASIPSVSIHAPVDPEGAQSSGFVSHTSCTLEYKVRPEGSHSVGAQLSDVWLRWQPQGVDDPELLRPVLDPTGIEFSLAVSGDKSVHLQILAQGLWAIIGYSEVMVMMRMYRHYEAAFSKLRRTKAPAGEVPVLGEPDECPSSLFYPVSQNQHDKPNATTKAKPPSTRAPLHINVNVPNKSEITFINNCEGHRQPLARLQLSAMVANLMSDAEGSLQLSAAGEMELCGQRTTSNEWIPMVMNLRPTLDVHREAPAGTSPPPAVIDISLGRVVTKIDGGCMGNIFGAVKVWTHSNREAIESAVGREKFEVANETGVVVNVNVRRQKPTGLATVVMDEADIESFTIGVGKREVISSHTHPVTGVEVMVDRGSRDSVKTGMLKVEQFSEGVLYESEGLHCMVTGSNFSRLLVIGGMHAVINRTAVPMTLTLNHPNVTSIDVPAHGGRGRLPAFFEGKTSLQPAGVVEDTGRSFKKSSDCPHLFFPSVASLPPGLIECDDADGSDAPPFTMVAKKLGTGEIEIDYPVYVENALPEECVFQVHLADGTRRRKVLSKAVPAGACVGLAAAPSHQAGVAQWMDMSLGPMAEWNGSGFVKVWTAGTPARDEFMDPIELQSGVEGEMVRLEVVCTPDATSLSRKLTVYCPYWLVNSTGLPLMHREDSATRKMLLGGMGAGRTCITEEKPLMFGFTKTRGIFKEQLSICVDGGEWSVPFSVDTIGVVGSARTSTPGGATVDIGVNIEGGPGVFSRTRIVRLVPKHVVVNETGQSIAIVRSGPDPGIRSNCPVIEMGPGEAINLQPDTRDRQPQGIDDNDATFVMMSFDGGREWQWSGGISMERMGETVLVNRQRSLAWETARLTRADVRVSGATTYLVFSDMEPSRTVHIYENHMSSPVTFGQAGSQRPGLCLPPGTGGYFGWDEPHRLARVVSVSMNGKVLGQMVPEENVSEEAYSLLNDGPGITVETALYKGAIRVIVRPGQVSAQKRSALNPDQERTHSTGNAMNVHGIQVNVHWGGLQASLRDVNGADALGVDIGTTAVVVSMRKGEVVVQLTMDDASMDGIAGTKREAIVRRSKSGKEGPLVDLLLHVSMLHPGTICIPCATIRIATLDIDISTNFINNLTRTFKDISRASLGNSSETTSRTPGGHDLNLGAGRVDFERATAAITIPTVSSHRRVYINFLDVGPVGFNISFHPYTTVQMGDAGIFVSRYLLRIMSNLGHIDGAPIRLRPLVACKVFERQADVVSRIRSHYTRQFVLEAYKIVGSNALIGNPMGLVSSVGTGVYDLFNEPVRGLASGRPDEFIQGIGKGAMSFVSNTTGGVLNSASLIAGSIGRGVATLALSDDYVSELNQQNRQAGVRVGAAQAGRAVRDGVTGIVNEPVRGAKEAGFGGMVKGLGKGLTGAIAKPVSGIFGGASRAADGLRRSFDGKR